MKTILIFGANGMLGRYIMSYLSQQTGFKLVPITRKEIDVENVTNTQLSNFLQKYPQSYVINCIGKIPQRGDNDVRSYIKINSIFPNVLSYCCKENRCKMIHITTDCVFSGMSGNYTENDKHDGNDIYSISKSLGEPDNCCIIRTSIIGEELINKKSLLEWVRSNNGNTIGGYVNCIWNGVTCLQLAKIISEIINKNMYWLGVRHIFSPQKISKYHLVKTIVDVYKLDIIVEEKITEPSDKSLVTVYDKIFDIPPIEEQIIQMKEFSSCLF